jgi:uncharacterized protein YueI
VDSVITIICLLSQSYTEQQQWDTHCTNPTLNQQQWKIHLKKNIETKAARHQYKNLNKIKTSEPAIVTNLQRTDIYLPT